MCGYDTTSRQKGKKLREKEHPDTVKQAGLKNWERRAAYDFTGCLAHADITFVKSDPPIITRILGYFIHNNKCIDAKLRRFPSIPLHPHVREVALRQMRRGARYVSEVLNIQTELT